MTEYLDLDKETLFNEVVERALAEGVNEREAFEEFVDFVVQEKLQIGEADADEPLPGLTIHLKERWPEYQERLES